MCPPACPIEKHLKAITLRNCHWTVSPESLLLYHLPQLTSCVTASFFSHTHTHKVYILYVHTCSFFPDSVSWRSCPVSAFNASSYFLGRGREAHAEVPGPGTKLPPQQRPETQQWQLSSTLGHRSGWVQWVPSVAFGGVCVTFFRWVLVSSFLFLFFVFN